MSRVQLLQWCDESRDMNDIYVTLKLQSRSGIATKLLSNNEDLVCVQSLQGEPETRILLKGVAGTGKSTLLAKLAYTWAEQKNDSPLANFELLFILSLREVKHSSLIDEIFDQIFESHTRVSKDGLKQYIEVNPQAVLLLLDGFDEYSASDLSNPVGSLQEILTFKSFRDCYTILSTRPHKDLKDHQSSYVVVDVLGFSRKNVKLYMQRFFNGNNDMVQGLQVRLEESERLIYLSKIPVILMLMCLLWEDENKLPDTQTQLYQEFFSFLWRKYCIRCGTNVYFNIKLDSEFEPFISRLGQVALDGLCSEKYVKEVKIVFTDIDFGKSFQLGCETGLLSRERLRSKLSRRSAVTFLHISFQEFCAAKYWASLYTTDPDQFTQILSRLESWTVLMRKIELVKFCCGLVELGGVNSIIRHVIDVYLRISHPKDICIGYYKPNDGKKHIVNILSLLYENQRTPSDCDSNDDSINPQSSVSQQCQDKPISRTECSFDPPGEDCATVKSPKSGALKSSLTQSFKAIFPDDGFTLAVANKYPKAISIFHTFVRSELGFSILSTVKSISFENPHLSKLVVDDTLKCMSYVQDVKFKFSEVDPNVKYEFENPIQSAVESVIFVNPHLCSCYVAYIIRSMSNAHVHDVSVTFSEFDHFDQLGVMLIDKQCLAKLPNLKLTFAKLKGDHIKILSEYLPKVSNLQELNVSDNDLGMAIRPLAQQLQYCTKLTRLNLSNTRLEEDHIKIVSELLPKVTNLQELDVSENNVGMAIGPLAHQLQFCPMLSKVHLRNAGIADEGVIELSQRFVSMRNLTHLDLWHGRSYFGNHAVDALFKHIHHLTKLQYLRFSCKLDNKCSDRVKDCIAATGKSTQNSHIEMKQDAVQLLQNAASKYL
ncbi:NLR family CARD domain-containing protein 4-like [Amphiura filiformis]|uniref:NLR family CARD domain-containing protein 4-like n=1 Tax=Amphiura filiformis TaxID=82378 RepID=UPI003B215631